MENASLVGLSRQIALQRELDVVANNIANINTTGYKADNTVFQEFMIPVARANQIRGPAPQPPFVPDRATPTPLRADAARRALYAQRRVADQQPGPARHLGRLGCHRAERADRVPAERSRNLDR